MRNEKLFQKYKDLCYWALRILTPHPRWQDQESDASIHHKLRVFSGIDDKPGASKFSEFITEVLKNPILSRLYSNKDLEAILIYHLQYPAFQLAMLNNDVDEMEIQLDIEYSRFEDSLYEEDWTVSTIYPLFNFHSKHEWETRQQAEHDGAPIKNRIADDYRLSFDEKLEIKQIPFVETNIGRQGRHFPYHRLAMLRDFTGNDYAIEAKTVTRKSATSQHNLLSHAIGKSETPIDENILYEGRDISDLPELLLLALRLFKPGDIGIAPYRYIRDNSTLLYMPGFYPQRYSELAQVEDYKEAPYILAQSEGDSLKKLCRVLSNLLANKPSDLEHINIAQRYFQYSYSHKLTDNSRLQDRVINLLFALEALLLLPKNGRKAEGFGDLIREGKRLIGDLEKNFDSLIKAAYVEIRDPVAHGREPKQELTKEFVITLENCVRHVLKRVIGLAVQRNIRDKESLRDELQKAQNQNKLTHSGMGTEQLRQDADTPLL